MWDTWLYYHEGTHYLYYLHKSSGNHWDGMSVATSKDGVRYDEVGPIISIRDDAEWLGTGSVWRAGDKFILNFSESRDHVQAVFFAESTDLLNWNRLGDEFRSDPDPRWYDNTKTGRWDCIWSIPKPSGDGFYGYLTARPWSNTRGIDYESVGMVESEDGARWHAVAPPPFEWGDWPPLNLGEVGAIEKVGDRYYLMLGYGECSLGNRWVWDETGVSAGGMYSFVGERPEGPFRPDTDFYRLLVTNGTYFSRFYRTPDEVLVNHHSIERTGEGPLIWMAPLKKAVIEDGHLRLGYWDGNEALKDRETAIDLTRSKRSFPSDDEGTWQVKTNSLEVEEPAGGSITLLSDTYDLQSGIVLEGKLAIFPSERPWGGIGLYIETEGAENGGTGIMMETRGKTELGRISSPERGGFVPSLSYPTGILAGRDHQVRMLARRTMIELYIDDLLVCCHSLDAQPTGRLGLIHEAGRAVFENLRISHMNL